MKNWNFKQKFKDGYKEHFRSTISSFSFSVFRWWNNLKFPFQGNLKLWTLHLEEIQKKNGV